MKTRIRAVILLLAGGLALSACSDDTDTPPTTEAAPTSEAAPVTAAPSTTPPDDVEQTSTEPELSAEEQDEADVEETLRAYMSALDEARNGQASIEEIYPYSRDTAREQWITQLMAYQAQGITIEGAIELEVLEVSVDGDSAEVLACADVSKTDAFDRNGQSIIPADRPDRTLTDFVLERDESAEMGWYVTDDANRDEPCVG